MIVKPSIKEGFTYLKPKSDEEMRKDFNPEIIKAQLNGTQGAEVVVDTNKFIIAKITKFEAAAKLGSPNWNITKNKSSWENQSDSFHNVYFIWDFTIPADPLRFLCVSIDPNGKVKSTYDARNQNVTNQGEYLKKFD